MAPVSLRKLTASQNSRLAEIRQISARLRERDRSSLNRNIIMSRIEALKEIWKDMRGTHAEIVGREEAARDPYMIENQYDRSQVAYEDALDFLLTLQSELEITEQPTLPVSLPISHSSPRPELRAAKIPRLDLPSFSGQFEDWENFCDLFTTLVHDAPHFADATKLQYLKTCLKGAAAGLVKDVSTTNANYATTWQALKSRFHKPRMIVNNHLRALMDIPYLKKESATELRSFADEAQRIVRALTNLQMPVDHWDVWLVFTLAARLDPESRKEWESELSAKDQQTALNTDLEVLNANPLARFPKFSDLSEFMERRVQTLIMIASESTKPEKRLAASSKPLPGTRKIFHASSSPRLVDKKQKCPICSGIHSILKCFRFRSKTPLERRRAVRHLQLCFNCLGQHKVQDCTSSFRCLSCKEKHHSMIHLSPPSSTLSADKGSVSTVKPQEEAMQSSGVNIHTACITSRKHTVLLATAQLILEGPHGTRTRVRALLDQGSETSFVSDSVANILGLRKCRVNIPLTGLGTSSAGTARLATHFTVHSLVDPSFLLETKALILPKLTSQLPACRSMELNFEMFSGLVLADPQFYRPDSVDVILGADVYGQLLRTGLRRFPSSALVAQETVLGWIISGPVVAEGSRRAAASSQMSSQVLHCATEEDSDLNQLLRCFWELEEAPATTIPLKPQDEACERLFRESHARDSGGRFVVRLPFKAEPPPAGAETCRMAKASLAHMYRRFTRDDKLAVAYRDFMTTYEALGHMERVPTSDINNPRAWYLPHHAVVRSTESTWKIRVVFDASRKTLNKQCLNDFLMTGPALQRDLSLILLNWRRYRYVFTADIVKMFRQISVAPGDRDFQRILWSPSSSEAPSVYRLTTVTYGTACAPYLAIRTLSQLAEDEKSRYPLGAHCLEWNTYVDDTFAGADELPAAKCIQQELIGILSSAGIELDKWAANHSNLLPSRVLNSEVDETKTISLDESVKTLGVLWNPGEDEFRFTTLDFTSLVGASTKRSVLSNIARLFDPLGWLTPITVVAKILMQDLWIVKVDWDATLPIDIRERWLEYCNSLSLLPSLSIKRWFGASSGLDLQIHGFSDASSRAYAAAAYIRINEGNGRFRVSLLAARSKVAPVKTVSIPNLELCGAVLLVKLLCHLRKLEFLRNLTVFAWTDSQIVLTWLGRHPCHWKSFVANRVSFVQTELPSATWAHVSTKENPADLASRGCKPVDLLNADLWWHGPDWLVKDEEHWPKVAMARQTLLVKTASREADLLTRFSSLTRLTRVVAYCLRPLVRLRRRKNGLGDLPGFLTSSELSGARMALIRIVQLLAFEAEIKLLQSGVGLPKRHPLLSLNPSVDKDSILRVGGRLANSSLSFNSKHPPILPRRSWLSCLYVQYAHIACMHGGPTLTSGTVMRNVWILGRNRLVKTIIRNCVTCQRVKPRLAHQMMGDLPAARVSPARAFTSAGLDYAGPFQIRTTKGRGYKAHKGYIALFVCFATRAIHLEAVSDLTTLTFLAAFRRFAGRRGICRHLYSDNATTFQAADKELRTMFQAASKFYKEAAASIANDGTDWTFIPANSPHYGGLWEAGVKSVKHHLKRAIGDTPLTFEEFSTVLVEIEACLNSRPLYPLSADIEDLQALTPAHFLLGEQSGLVPDEEPPNIPEHRLERFHLLQTMRNRFWKRWSEEYLQHLQERAKWRGPTKNFEVGQLVLVRDDRYPPSKWPLGRVTEVHMGPDGLVRVATVRTATSTLKRHIARLCPLLTEQAQSEAASNGAAA